MKKKLWFLKKDIKYYFKKKYYRYKLFKRFLKYPYFGPWEMVEPMLEIPFEMLSEFYETNKEDLIWIDPMTYPDDYGQRKSVIKQNEDYDKIENLYVWWKYGRKKHEEIISYLASECSLHFNLRTETKYYQHLRKLLTNEEMRFWDNDEKALISLVKLRKRLWT